MIRTLHHVRNERVPDWLRVGWIVVKSNCQTHHDYYSVTMEWLCDCKMVKPR